MQNSDVGRETIFIDGVVIKVRARAFCVCCMSVREFFKVRLYNRTTKQTNNNKKNSTKNNNKIITNPTTVYITNTYTLVNRKTGLDVNFTWGEKKNQFQFSPQGQICVCVCV